MSHSHSERRLSLNGRNAYLAISAKELTHSDNQKKSDDSAYLSLKPRSPINTPTCSTLHTPTPANSSLYHSQPTGMFLTPNPTGTPFDSQPKSMPTPSSNIDNINMEKPIPTTRTATTTPTGTIPKQMPVNKTVQTGLDVYFPILKRKLSPKSTQQNPTPKLLKNGSTAASRNTLDQNYYASLATDESEPPPTKEHKPPPIYVRDQISNSMVNKISRIVGQDNFHVVSLRKGNVLETKVQTYTEDNYRNLVKYLDANGKSYYTYQLKSSKGLQVVIKGLESDFPIETLKEALEREGYEVKSVHNIINRNTIPQPLFKVEIAFDFAHMKKKNEPHPIYSLQYLENRRISVEEPHKRNTLPQCLNCQEYGHTKKYCKLPAVCVICGNIHKTSECKLPKTDPKIKKCGNCGGNHTANYRGCPVYIELRKKYAVRRSEVAQPQFQYQALEFKSLPTTSQPLNNTNPVASNSMTYAQSLKDPLDNSQKSSLECSIVTLISTMNGFMANMQGIMQEMLRNQNMLMQALLAKK